MFLRLILRHCSKYTNEELTIVAHSAIAKQYLAGCGRRLPLKVVKYGSKLQAIVTHNHLKLSVEITSNSNLEKLEFS